jgi:hypothetical protein
MARGTTGGNQQHGRACGRHYGPVNIAILRRRAVDLAFMDTSKGIVRDEPEAGALERSLSDQLFQTKS